MPSKRHKPDEIVAKLRQVDVLVSQGLAVADAIRSIGVSEVTYYALLREASWQVNAKRVERIWRREGLKVPPRQPKRARLWLADGSCSRLRPERPNHVRSYDFVEDRTHDGRKFRMINVVEPRRSPDIDEVTHECLAIPVARKLKAADVIDVLAGLVIPRGVPGHIRSDNGPEFVAKQVQQWITAVGAKTAYIAPGSPWENGYVESFKARLRDELLEGRIFYNLRGRAAERLDQVAIKSWRRHYNTIRPCIPALQATSAGGGPACLRCLARRVVPTGFAHPANRGAPTRAELTFTSDHTLGADHSQSRAR